MLPLPSRPDAGAPSRGAGVAAARGGPGARARVGALAAVILLAPARPGTATALGVALDPPRLRADTVWVDVRLLGLFDSRVEESLSRGMPATLQLHAELWHRRSGWF